MSLFVPGQEFPAWGPSVPVLKQREAHRLERTNKVLNEQVEVRGKVFFFLSVLSQGGGSSLESIWLSLTQPYLSPQEQIN